MAENIVTTVLSLSLFIALGAMLPKNSKPSEEQPEDEWRVPSGFTAACVLVLAILLIIVVGTIIILAAGQ